jgi:hypothetical protein
VDLRPAVLAFAIVLSGCATTGPVATTSSGPPLPACAQGLAWAPNATGDGFHEVFRKPTQIGPLAASAGWVFWYEADVAMGRSRACALGPGGEVRDLYDRPGRNVTGVLAADGTAWFSSYPASNAEDLTLHSWTPAGGLATRAAPAGHYVDAIGPGWIGLWKASRYIFQSSRDATRLLDTAELRHPVTGDIELPLTAGEVQGMPAVAFRHANQTVSVVRIDFAAQDTRVLFWVDAGSVESLTGTGLAVAYSSYNVMRVRRWDGQDGPLDNATTIVDWASVSGGVVHYVESDIVPAAASDYRNATVRFGELDTAYETLQRWEVGRGKSFASAVVTPEAAYVGVVESADPAVSVLYRMRPEQA